MTAIDNTFENLIATLDAKLEDLMEDTQKSEQVVSVNASLDIKRKKAFNAVNIIAESMETLHDLTCSDVFTEIAKPTLKFIIWYVWNTNIDNID